MDWTTIITTAMTLLLGGGGIIGLVTVKDKKYSAMLDNVKSAIETSSKTNDEWKDIAQQWREECQEYKQSLEKKDAKIDAMYVCISQCREKTDNLKSQLVECDLYRCDKMDCPDRIPPFGSHNQEIRRKVNDNK